jgi:hypothetical protein
MATAASSARNYMDDMNQQTRQHELSEEIANAVVTILSKHPRHTDSMEHTSQLDELEHTSQLDELVNHDDYMHLDSASTWAAQKLFHGVINNPKATMRAGKFAARWALPGAGPAMDAVSHVTQNKHFKNAVHMVNTPENRARAQQMMPGHGQGNNSGNSSNTQRFQNAAHMVTNPQNRAHAQQFAQGARDGNYAGAFHGAQQLFHAMRKH